MISYTFSQDILTITFCDVINLDGIKNYLKEFDSLEYLPEKLLLLYDLSNADLQIAPGEIKEISEIANISTQAYTSTKTAFLVNDPKITAYTTLFSNFVSNSKTQRKIFSTKEAALNWLKGPNK